MSDDGALIHSARRFAKQMNILVAMEEDCNCQVKEIIPRLRAFYTEPVFQERVVHWVEWLYKTGQRIRDWDICWRNYTEIEDETRKQFPNLSTEELITQQMVINTIQQYNELTRYREMYPGIF